MRVPVSVGAEKLAEKLERFKEENDAPPVDARLVPGHGATEHAAGKYVDVYAAMSALDRALLAQAAKNVTAASGGTRRSLREATVPSNTLCSWVTSVGTCWYNWQALTCDI